MTVNIPVPVVMPMAMPVADSIGNTTNSTAKYKISNFDSVLMAKEHVWSGDFYGIFD